MPEKPDFFTNGPLVIAASLLVAAIMISGSILYVGRGTTATIGAADQQLGDTQNVATVDAETLVDDDPVEGKADAKVTIVEFSDFQCPFCRKFFIETYGQLKKDYIDTGKVRLVFRDFPLVSLHPSAESAALAAQCANEQGTFWQFHDKIFSEQMKRESDPTTVQTTITFSVDDLKTWASQIGVDNSKFNQCLDSKKYAQEVQKDTDAGTQAGVDGTPTFFIGSQRVVGAQPYSVIKTAIEQELAK